MLHSYTFSKNITVGTQTYQFSMNNNGGNGTISGFSVKYGDTFKIPANTFTKTGYTFAGWNVKRNDNKWHVSGKGWLTESDISSKGYTKNLYADKRQLTFDSSWTDGYNGVSTYTFYAVWTPKTVTGVSLDKTTLTLSKGSNATLKATINPSDAATKTVSWTSSNTSVASVNSSGQVTAVSAGTATITVKTVDGGKTATCTVTVPDTFVFDLNGVLDGANMVLELRMYILTEYR